MQSVFARVQYPAMLSPDNATNTRSHSEKRWLVINFDSVAPAFHEQFSAYTATFSHNVSLWFNDLIFIRYCKNFRSVPLRRRVIFSRCMNHISAVMPVISATDSTSCPKKNIATAAVSVYVSEPSEI